MAAGKSEVARVLATELGWPSFDVDRLIEARWGEPVAELFSSRGEAWFREKEAEVTEGLLLRRGVIVAPGGGWAAQPGRWDGVPGHVLSVWLRVGLDEALARADRAPGTRPLLADREAVGDLLRRREPYYERAELHLDTEGASAVEVARRIIEHLGRR